MLNANEPKIEQLTDIERARLEGRVEAIGAMANAFEHAINILKTDECPAGISPKLWQGMSIGTEKLFSTILTMAPASLGIIVSRQIVVTGGIHLSINVNISTFRESLKRCNHTVHYTTGAEGGKSC